jgi:hypothetical protein
MGAEVTRGGFEVKCATLRAHLTQIEKLGFLPDLVQKVPKETRQCLEALPLPSAWVDGMILQDVVCAIDALRGPDVLRMVTMKAQQAGTTPLLMPVVGGVMRLFGATPSTLLSRFGDLIKTQLRGAELKWTPASPTSGNLSVIFPRKGSPHAAYVGFESGCKAILELCGVKGTVEPTQIGKDGAAGIIAVSWTGK